MESHILFSLLSKLVGRITSREEGKGTENKFKKLGWGRISRYRKQYTSLVVVLSSEPPEFEGRALVDVIVHDANNLVENKYFGVVIPCCGWVGDFHEAKFKECVMFFIVFVNCLCDIN